jgi:acyl dehydratase
MEARMADIASFLEDTGFALGAVIESPAWVQIPQEMIDGFARYTIDPDPFHIDPAWAQEHSPFGGTIAFGFLTISLLTHLLHKAQGSSARDTSADPAIYGHYLNYGFDRLRLISPVHVNSRIRGKFTVKDLRVDSKNRCVVTFEAIIEIETEERPALIAEWLAIWVPGTGA